MTVRRLQYYIQNAQTIRLPVTLEELQKPLTSNKQAKLMSICDNELGEGKPARATSAQYVDRNGVPILFYLGHRVVTDKAPVLYSIFYFLFTLSLTLSLQGYHRR
jgi:hypothetical protein